jgi:hypothetical protein
MKKIKNMKNINFMKNMKGSCVCLLLLTIVIVYLSVKPEGFKEGHEIRYRHNHYGIDDISHNDISHNHISHNHIKYVYVNRLEEKETEKEKEIKPIINQTVGVGLTPLTTTTTTEPLPQNIFDWFDLNKFTNAHLAMVAIIFVLFIIIMFIIIKLTQPQPQTS